ncbi:hypothetical protein [Oceanobacter mangrovi]|uniref:hypothetical protein n=1 Tax=Oceanobacter mangrovi TaxID=2862510 RepID=UPI001C8EF36A|nr:hypothetical protein [Oceanobacter mangrovi]
MSAVIELSKTFQRRAERVRDQLIQPVQDIGLALKGIDMPFAETEERRDPYDGSITTYGFWRDANGQLLGTVQIDQSGRVFAEYDVIANHPNKAGWFIASVSVWGGDDKLQSELQLIRLPE